MQAGEQPVLWGRVLLETSSGLKPLRKAKIELLDERAERILYISYTDSYGDFAFHEIPQGNYYLMVLLGERVLRQREGDGTIDKRLVQVTDESTRLPDIIVLP